MPESLTSLGYRFIQNTAIESIIIPKNVTYAGYSNVSGYSGPLNGCTTLKNLVFAEGMTKIPQYMAYFSDSASSYIESVTIPSTVSEIGAQAFYHCNSLKSVDIPESVAKIGDSAFSGCTDLKSVVLHYNDTMINTPSSGTQRFSLEIGYSAFSQCSALTDIELTENITKIDSYAFSGCTSLKELVLPQSLKTIGGSFIANTSIEEITIPKNVTEAYVNGAYGALNNCSSLKNLVFEDGITKIPYRIAYFNNSNSYIENVTIPSTVSVIEEGAFRNCRSLKSINIPKSVSFIGESAFASCINLESVELNYNDSMVTTQDNGIQLFSLKISDSAFAGCTKLKDINLTENITSIGSYAFSGCTSLKELVLPQSLKTIGGSFIANTSIEEITIPKNVTEAYVNGAYGALNNCSSLKNLVFEDGITKIPYRIAYFNNSNSYIENVTIPSTVSVIEVGAFCNCNNLATVYYEGKSEDDWNAINIASDNDPLINATKVFHQHTYDNGIILPATCSAQGYTIFTCTTCGESYKDLYIDKLPHTVVNISAKDATCTEAGITSGSYCSVCGEVFEESHVIPATGHNYSSRISRRATCEEDGEKTFTCSICGNSYVESIPAIGHNYSIKGATVEATCTEAGYTVYYCSNCGNSKREAIPMLDHNYILTVVESTCSAMGYTEHKCNICGDSYKTDFIKQTEHDYEMSVIAPTCAARGFTEYTCKICGDSYKNNYIATLAHTEGDWIVDTPATCSRPGAKIKKCTTCGKTIETETIDMVPHIFVDTITEPTQTSQGYTTHRCSECGYSYIDNYTNYIPENPITVLVESKKVNTGKEFTVSVNIKNNSGFSYLELTPIYPEEFTLVSVANGELLSDFTKGKQYIWVSNEDITADGNLMTFTFRTSKDIEPGEYEVGFNVRNCVNYSEDILYTVVEKGVIEMFDFTYGDANGDDIINGQDVVRLKKYLANYDYDTETSTIEIFAGADANGDGVINGQDVVRLKKYLANYDYETETSTVVLGPTN